MPRNATVPTPPELREAKYAGYLLDGWQFDCGAGCCLPLDEVEDDGEQIYVRPVLRQLRDQHGLPAREVPDSDPAMDLLFAGGSELESVVSLFEATLPDVEAVELAAWLSERDAASRGAMGSIRKSSERS